ncbi:hypothetical protein [Ostreibacterium oceani]|uniref:Uncharacterized protein n=1 Tax=Ostreibacterium oceani TaxID=2654998 RepID=A0A6N7F026_9GAMM|nr:hypothetical protein [Ostreibacterium oceani]MPV86128.1 hypothetical protein [Ostreibacterium oceani]
MKNKLMLTISLAFVAILLVFGLFWRSNTVQQKTERFVQDYFLLNELSDQFQYNSVSTNLFGNEVTLEDFALIADGQINVIGDLTISDLTHAKDGTLTQAKLAINNGHFDFRVIYNHELIQQLNLEDFLWRHAYFGYSQAQGNAALSFNYNPENREASFTAAIDWFDLFEFSVETQIVRLHPDMVQLVQSTWFDNDRMTDQLYSEADRYHPLFKAISIAETSGKIAFSDESYQRGMANWLANLKLTEMTDTRLEKEFEDNKKWYYDNLEGLALNLRLNNAEALANFNIKNHPLQWESQLSVPFGIDDYGYQDVVKQLQLKLTN